MEKLNIATRYMLDRLGEPGTWQGIGFFVGILSGHHLAGLNWGEAAGLGGAISGAIKTFLPDIRK